MGSSAKFLLLSLAVLALGVSSARAQGPTCHTTSDGLDRALTNPRLTLAYPSGEQFRESEGWTLLAVTIAPDGAISDVWLRDTIGSDVYGQIVSDALTKGKFDPPPMLSGEPVQVGAAFEVAFRLDPNKRRGDHNYYREALDRAAAARARGNWSESVQILKNSLSWPLDLYEMTTMSHALAVSYLGLNDWRRALRHMRHATIENGMIVDQGVRAPALAIVVELQARDHNYFWANCAYEIYKRQNPQAPDSATLAAAMAETRTALTSATPIRTDVEILEQDRADLRPHWSHRLLRSSFAIENVQGSVKSYRLDCVGHTDRSPIVPGKRVALPPGVRCDLYVMGDAGARFVLDEG